MLNSSRELLNEAELRFSRERSFFDTSPLVTICIGLLFACALFSILHFREIRINVLQVNRVAPNYIIAQFGADFYDEEATLILRQEAVRDVGKIFRLSEDEVRKNKLAFENILLYNHLWEHGVSGQELAVLYGELDHLERLLIEARFTDPRTLQKLEESGEFVQHYFVYTPADLQEAVRLPLHIWIKIFEKAFPNTWKEGGPWLALHFLEQQSWHIDEDVGAQRILRRDLQSKVADKYSHIAAGSRIVNQGERVTARHVAMMEAIQKSLQEQRRLWSWEPLLGSAIMSLLLTLVCAAYLKINYPTVLSSNKRLFLIVVIALLVLSIAKLTEYILLASGPTVFEWARYPVFVPLAAILLCSLVNPGIATFASGFLTILLTMTLVFDTQGFMIMNLAAAIMAILTTRSLRRRKEIFLVCAKAWMACAAVALSIHLYKGAQGSMWLQDVLSSGVCMLLTAILTVGIMPLLESAFGIMTDAALMEYMDSNNDLLRRLSIEAPGTYQHSVLVGALAEAAATAIGANGLFCRVATLYHDVGKMATPQYFTENQQGGINIHQLLTPTESAQVIIAHVPEGVIMAKKADLPEQFIDIIREHHGTTLTYYFYRKQLDLVGGDATKVDETQFRYAGPSPRSKESAIIMIADSLEAASRSLDKVNEEALRELADQLVQGKAEDGQFDHCLLTLEELAIVKTTLVKALVALGHTRVKYPKRETENTCLAVDG